MPYYSLGYRVGQSYECPILPEGRHLSLASSLRRRLISPSPENRGQEGYQVAKRGEFRYIERAISQYRAQIVQTGNDKGSKMIANGRFLIKDRPRGRPAGCREWGNRGFRISLPARMIQDSYTWIDDGDFNLPHDQLGYCLRRRASHPTLEKVSLEGYQVAQKGELRYMALQIWVYRARIARNPYGKVSKMIAIGRFPASNRLPGQGADRRARKNSVFPKIPGSIIFDGLSLEERIPSFSGGPAECPEGHMIKTNHEPEGMS